MTIIEYLAKKGVQRDTKHRSKHGVMYFCPLQAERTASFHVTLKTDMWFCHGCQQGGTLVKLVLLLEGYTTWQEAYGYLGKGKLPLQPGERVRILTKPTTYATDDMMHLFKIATHWWHRSLWSSSEQARQARHYLLTRGVSLSLLQQEQIGYAPSHPLHSQETQAFSQTLARESTLPNWREIAIACGLLMPDGAMRMQGRVTFSARDVQGRYCYFQGRIIPPYLSHYKYLGAKGCPKYPFFLTVEKPLIEGSIGVEAPMGALVLASYHIPGIATCGNGTIPQEVLRTATCWYWAQDHDIPRPIIRNGEIRGYAQPGEIQAQRCLQQCVDEKIPAFRLLPPREYKGMDEWICAEQSILPVLQALPGKKDSNLCMDMLQCS